MAEKFKIKSPNYSFCAERNKSSHAKLLYASSYDQSHCILVLQCNDLFLQPSYFKYVLYSQVSNKRAVWNKQAGSTFFWKLIIEQDGINEQGGNFSKN